MSNEFQANLELVSMSAVVDTNRAKFKAWALEKQKEAMSAAQKAAEASMARAAKRAGHVQHREGFLSKLINLFK